MGQDQLSPSHALVGGGIALPTTAGDKGQRGRVLCPHIHHFTVEKGGPVLSLEDLTRGAGFTAPFLPEVAPLFYYSSSVNCSPKFSQSQFTHSHGARTSSLNCHKQ